MEEEQQYRWRMEHVQVPQQNEKEREVMVRMAEMQKKLVREEADRMESMESWKARILGLSKDDAV